GQDCRLDAVHPTIPTHRRMIIFLRLTVVSQHLDLLPYFRVVRHDCASLAERAEILSGIKAEATSVAHCACLSPLVLGAVRLGGIFNDKEAVRAREFQNRIHVRRLPEKVNRNDRFGSLRQTVLKFRWIHCERVFVHIHKHWPSFAAINCLDRGEECVRNSDYFIALSNPKRQESEPKRVCAIAHTDGVLGATVGRELFFKSFHERSARKRATLDYLANSAIELVDQGRVLRLQIKKGNFHLQLGWCAENPGSSGLKLHAVPL